MMKLGISPIGWSNDDLPELGASISFEQCIEEIAEAGYQGCEVGHKFPSDPKLVLEHLSSYNLQVCGKWFDYRLSSESLDSNLERMKPHLEYLQALDCSIIGGGEKGSSCVLDEGSPLFQYESIYNVDQYKRYGEYLTKCGELAATYNLKLVFHHHLGTIVNTLEETRFLLAYSDPDYVGLNYDTAHASVSGSEPLDFLSEVIDRVVHVHLKNVRSEVVDQLRLNEGSFLQAIRSGLFTVPGDESGSIDFIPIIQMLKSHQYTGWLVIEADQDPQENKPLQMAEMAHKYVSKIL